MLNRVLRSRIPDEITQRLKSLSSDITHVLLDPEHNSFQPPSLQGIASNVPKNLQEITHYYFHQGGKLLRPTVSLLMSDACNGSSFNARSDKQVNLDLLNLNQYRVAMIAVILVLLFVHVQLFRKWFTLPHSFTTTSSTKQTHDAESQQWMPDGVTDRLHF